MEQSEVELIKARLIGPSADGNQFNASYPTSRCIVTTLLLINGRNHFEFSIRLARPRARV